MERRMREPHLGTNRVHMDDLANFEAQCLIDGNECDVKNKPLKKNGYFLHVNVSKTYVAPKSRRAAIKDIELVLKYSRKVYGSCIHAYMGSMAMHRYDSILNGATLKTAELHQIVAAHKLVFGYLTSARR
jgi:hypothetical protein